jgi:hypothetical protein
MIYWMTSNEHASLRNLSVLLLKEKSGADQDRSRYDRVDLCDTARLVR